MILRSEIRNIAQQIGVPPSTIDKDWTLGHVVAEFACQDWSRDNLLFKGGTCLKKCFFPGYRFSEDIDYTIISGQFHLDKDMIQAVCDRVTEKTGIIFAPITIDKIISLDKDFGYRIILKFWGGDHRRDQAPPNDFNRWHTSIKIEMTLHELLCFPRVLLPLNDAYSDSERYKGITIPCYHLFEIFTEKLRATIQRSYPAPRDYYDLWNLSKEIEREHWQEIIDAFKKKAKFKKISFTRYQDFFESGRVGRSGKAWKESLGAHLPSGALPPFELVISELQEILSLYFN